MADTSNNLNQENIYSYNSKTGYNPAVQQAALGNLINQYSQPSQPTTQSRSVPQTNIYSAPTPQAQPMSQGNTAKPVNPYLDTTEKVQNRSGQWVTKGQGALYETLADKAFNNSQRYGQYVPTVDRYAPTGFGTDNPNFVPTESQLKDYANQVASKNFLNPQVQFNNEKYLEEFYNPYNYKDKFNTLSSSFTNNNTVMDFLKNPYVVGIGEDAVLRPEYAQLFNMEKLGVPTLKPVTFTVGDKEYTVTPDIPDAYYHINGMQSPREIEYNKAQKELAQKQQELTAYTDAMNKNYKENFTSGGFKWDPNTMQLYKMSKNISPNTGGIRVEGVGTSVADFLNPATLSGHLMSQGWRPSEIANESKINQERARRLQSIYDYSGGTIDKFVDNDPALINLFNNLLSQWKQGLSG